MELVRLGWMTRREDQNHIFKFYPHLEHAHRDLIYKHFDADPAECPVTQTLFIVLREGAPCGAYCEELIQDEKFAHLDKDISFEGRVEIAKALLEIDMTYKQKQQEYNAGGVYVHYHKLMSFHRKLTDALMG